MTKYPVYTQTGYFSDTQRNCSLIWGMISGSPYSSVLIHVNWSKYMQLLVMWHNEYIFNALFLKQKGSIWQNIWSWQKIPKVAIPVARYTRYWISNQRHCKLKLRRKYSNFHAVEIHLTEQKNCSWSTSSTSVGSAVIYWTRGWVTRISPFNFYFFSLMLKYLSITTNATHFYLFFEAERHAGVSCVTALVDDIQFKETARYVASLYHTFLLGLLAHLQHVFVAPKLIHLESVIQFVNQINNIWPHVSL